MKDPLNSRFFSDLANENRLAIINLLNQDKMRPSQVAKRLGMSIQASKKHFDKLIESGLITKDGDGMISLSTVGAGIMTQLPAFEFLYQNKEFFKTHSLSYLPPEFVERIGELSNHKRVTGYVATVEEYKKIGDGAQEFANFIVAQVSLDIYSKHFPKLRDKQIKIRYIMGENAIIPKGWLDLTKKTGEDKMIQRGFLERKMTKRSHVMMLVTDKAALLMFPDNSGTVDPSIMFVSEDERFRKWCNDLFEYYWQRSSSFVESKIREV